MSFLINIEKKPCLMFQAQDFRQQGTKMKRKMWVQNMKIKLMVAGIILVILIIIIMAVCPGFRC